MTERDEEQQPHEAKAEALKRELDEMQERQERLGEDIGDAGDDWERQKRDSRVPGATSDEGDDEEESDGDAEELDFGRDLAPDEDD